MKKIDFYILKRYLLTLTALVLMFVPIGILIDLSEKIHSISRSNATSHDIVNYYFSFAIYYADLLFPIFLFISIIWFTSRMAQNTEIIAILSSGIAFKRLLRPYFVGAIVVGILVFVMEMFLVPKASKDYEEFTHKYVDPNHKVQETSKIFNQLHENIYVYVSSYKPIEKKGVNFTMETFEGNRLKAKITAKKIHWIDTLNTYRLTDYTKRIVGENEDIIEKEKSKDTLLSFNIEDLSQVSYVAETKNIFELHDFIAKEKVRGSPNINSYVLVAYKRWTMPITAFVLTVIAVAVSSRKRRGGIGVNLSFGMVVAFIYVFFDKVFGVMSSGANFPPLLAVSLPNIIFGVVALLLIKRTKR